MKEKPNTAQVRSAGSLGGLQNYFDAQHQIGAEYLPWAWEQLGLDPADYAHLEPPLANSILQLWSKIADGAWEPLMQAIRAHALEPELVALYEAFYLRHDWIIDAEAVSLALIPNMRYATAQGDKHGYVELVRLGDRVGMRAMTLSLDGCEKGILEPPVLLRARTEAGFVGSRVIGIP